VQEKPLVDEHREFLQRAKLVACEQTCENNSLFLLIVMGDRVLWEWFQAKESAGCVYSFVQLHRRQRDAHFRIYVLPWTLARPESPAAARKFVELVPHLTLKGQVSCAPGDACMRVRLFVLDAVPSRDG
jgi:hypothetical protein